MKHHYSSGVDPWLLGIIIITMGTVEVVMVAKGVWIGALLIALLTAWMLQLFLSTYYTLTPEELYVKSGLWYNKSFDLSDIVWVKFSNNPLSAPAASLKRIEIKFKQGNILLISPKDRLGFITQLQSFAPHVMVKK